MRRLAPEYKRALYWALGLHLSIVIMMLLQIDFPWQDNKPALTYAVQNVEVIQAQLVPQASLDKRENEKKQQVEAQKQKEIQLARAKEQKLAQEAALVAKEKEKQIQATRLAEAEAKKKAEAQKQAKLEKQKQAEAAKQKQAQAEADAAKAQELANQQQLVAQQQALAAQQAAAQQAMQSEIDRYTLMVKQKVMQNWLVQHGFQGYVTQLRVRVAPGGTVLDVQIISQSGNEALDRSAVSAVYRASPLPVPTDPAVFESFRDLRLILRPEDVLG